MGYVAARDMVVGAEEAKDENGNVLMEERGLTLVPIMVPVIRKAGEALPEAADWPNVDAYISTGSVVFVPEEVITMRAELDQMRAELDEMKKNIHTHNNPNKKGS